MPFLAEVSCSLYGHRKEVCRINADSCMSNMQASDLMRLFLKPNERIVLGAASSAAAAGDEQSGVAGDGWGGAGEGFAGDDDDNGEGFGGADGGSCEHPHKFPRA